MKHKKHTILVVEDQEINRKLLVRMFQNDYEVMEAANGEVALQLIIENKNTISAILLDIIMPVMNGYEVLQEMEKKGYNDLPVIVMTGEQGAESEEKALKLGAWDFVSKPYKPKVLLSRVQNAIARSEISYLKQIRHIAEHDTVTDLYNRRHFFEVVEKIQVDRDEEMAFVRMDINRFRMINAFWGESEGDRLLIYLAGLIEELIPQYPFCCYGHIESDVFGFVIPYKKEDCEKLLETIISRLGEYSHDYIVEPRFGIYLLKGRKLTAEMIYMRATMAAKSCKNMYMTYFAYYDDSMGDKLFQEQEIASEMQQALDHHEFVVYLQPKYNIQTETPYGAEALVRWKHPKKGMISPGLFVPVFEKNGFIAKLDMYMWEEVCKVIHTWVEEGKKPAPISVNMSRVEMYNPNLVNSLCQLVEKYKVDPDLFQLELTESAYMDNPEAMDEKIKQLHEAGFTILMDDFGSGFSSLNTLKDIDVDILKIDMNFLNMKKSDDTKSKKILTSIIRMASWIHLPVIVEGVETKEQRDFLLSIGCEYIQGYYYGKPMPVPEYEKLVENVNQVAAKLNQDLAGGYTSNKLPDHIREKIYKDEMTNAFNRRYLKEWLFLDMDDEDNFTGMLAIILLDVRGFKYINDNYGHVEGDKVLVKVVNKMNLHIRKKDSLIRFGGDEFMLILENCPEAVVKKKIEELREAVAEIEYKDMPHLELNMGYAYTNHFEKDKTFLDKMIQEADQKMFKNKSKDNN